MKTSERYICVHGHYYQPPRENPWLETVEVQDSASPYHDWNERITAECYAPNGAARVLNEEGKIVRILNNYARTSFDFGPTLLSWLKKNAQRTYQMVLDGDRASRERFSGHGSAMAQVYNHIIMPLANTRDRITQVRWGIADFESRFGRKPEGMWLAETAVDNETLDLLAQHGIRFTVLAPHQCARVRPLAATGAATPPAWVETPDSSVDTTQPYRVQLKEGRSIAVFFYDGAIARAVAFDGILNSGANFADRLLGGFHKDGKRPQLVHIATDGESYGHHHRYGEMALAYALRSIEQNKDVKLTNYAEFLAKFPPTQEAEVRESTSWSCSHGVERWRSNCGCNMGHAGWDQKWRTPLREALDLLRDSIAPLAEEAARPLLTDLWAARNGYVQVILDRTPESVQRFFDLYATHPLDQEERTAALRLMEMQRHALLMYTSCGWFFDDISGIETEQIIYYAARVLQLANRLFGEKSSALEAGFLAKMQTAKSNVPEKKDGAEIYRRCVEGQRIGLGHVAAHYAISSLFTAYPEEGQIFCYDVRRRAFEVFSSGRGRIAVGRAEVRSQITERHESIDYAVLHLGDHNLSAAVCSSEGRDDAAFAQLVEATRSAVVHADLPGVIRLFDRYFGATAYSLRSLFRDEQRRILKNILDSTLEEMEGHLRTLYEDHTALLHFLVLSGMPKPQALMLAAEFVVNADMRHVLEKAPLDTVRLHELLAQAEEDEVPLHGDELGYVASECIKQAMHDLQQDPSDMALLEGALELVQTLHTLPFEVSFWKAQNIWNALLRKESAAEHGPQWMEKFMELGRKMDLQVDELVVEE